MDLPTVCDVLKAKGVEVSSSTYTQLETYAYLVLKGNKVTNLTAHRTLDQLYEKSILDSLLFPLDSKIDLTYLDMGSGAGFPGIPLHLQYPFLITTLLEPNGKKANFLNKVITELGLKNIKILQDRAEVIGQQTYRQTFDLVTARAVTHLKNLLELAIPLLKVGGLLYAFKGSDFAIEIQESDHALQVMGAKIIEVKEASLPSASDKRVLIIIKKEKVTDKKYPRLFSQIKHFPL
jgi:16S rRNA (guanine527-N7)-methyltransferase